ncbi:MAG: hypothetical protein IPP78_06230 [Holophagaceae bacterium]|nr:hypothetical protein [Holophagaceae bacterium]
MRLIHILLPLILISAQGAQAQKPSLTSKLVIKGGAFEPEGGRNPHKYKFKIAIPSEYNDLARNTFQKHLRQIMETKGFTLEFMNNIPRGGTLGYSGYIYHNTVSAKAITRSAQEFVIRNLDSFNSRESGPLIWEVEGINLNFEYDCTWTGGKTEFDGVITTDIRGQTPNSVITFGKRYTPTELDSRFFNDAPMYDRIFSELFDRLGVGSGVTTPAFNKYHPSSSEIASKQATATKEAIEKARNAAERARNAAIREMATNPKSINFFVNGRNTSLLLENEVLEMNPVLIPELVQEGTIYLIHKRLTTVPDTPAAYTDQMVIWQADHFEPFAPFGGIEIPKGGRVLYSRHNLIFRTFQAQPGDPACCPSQETDQALVFSSGRFTLGPKKSRPTREKALKAASDELD